MNSVTRIPTDSRRKELNFSCAAAVFASWVRSFAASPPANTCPSTTLYSVRSYVIRVLDIGAGVPLLCRRGVLYKEMAKRRIGRLLLNNLFCELLNDKAISPITTRVLTQHLGSLLPYLLYQLIYLDGFTHLSYSARRCFCRTSIQRACGYRHDTSLRRRCRRA